MGILDYSMGQVKAQSIIVCLLLGCCLATPALAEKYFDTQGQRIVDRINASQLKQYLGELGYLNVDLDEDDDLIFKIDDTTVMLLISEDNDFLQFRIGWSETDADLKKINQWNQERRLSRAYLDSRGDPVLELDLDLTGGVTVDRIGDFVLTAKVSISSFMDEIL